MTAVHKVEIFSAGCALCQETIDLVNQIAKPGTEITVLSMQDADTMARAQSLGVKSVPAVAIDGTLASCCMGRGPDETVLRNSL